MNEIDTTNEDDDKYNIEIIAIEVLEKFLSGAVESYEIHQRTLRKIIIKVMSIA